jgi:hypothetical protein
LVFLATLFITLPAQATPPEQFAGCVTEDQKPYAAHIILKDIYDVKFNVYAIGVGDFDPQIEIRQEDGTLIGCSQDDSEMIAMGVNLPTVTAGNTTRSAHMTVRFYADEHPDEGETDFHVYITNKLKRNGQFVMIFEGPWITDGLDVDSFGIVPSELQVEQGIPLTVYVTNPDRQNATLDPVLTLSLGSEFQLVCERTSFAADCATESTPLDGYTVTRDVSTVYTLTGADVMLTYAPDTAGEELPYDIAALNQSSYGPYLFIVHWGLGYPPVVGP